MKSGSMKRTHSLGLIVLTMIAIILADVLSLAVSLAQTVSFSPATNFAVGTGMWPYAVAIGNLNVHVDGYPDLAVANSHSNSVSILLNSGTGTFGAATPITVGLNPTSVAIGDFDGDGYLDLAVANHNSANVSILQGYGDGSFSPPTNFAVGSGPISVAIGDFDGDGKPDLAVANAGGGVSILRNTSPYAIPGIPGTILFGAATNITVGSLPRFVAIGDFDGDNKLDLAVANGNDNNVSIFLNTSPPPGTGTISFSFWANYAVGSFPNSVAIGDFDGDGNLDLAMANLNDDNVSILQGDGHGSFSFVANYHVNRPFSVAIGDLNGDLKPDLAVANSANGNVSVFLNTSPHTIPGIPGTILFGAAKEFAVGTSPTSVAIGNLNHDNKLDLATANGDDDNVSILLNTTPVTAVKDKETKLPTKFSLSQNYPNPFNPSTTISYSLPKATNISLKILNTLGQEIAMLVNERKDAGSYQVQWNATVPSGIYFYRMQAGEFVETKKMIVLR